MTVLRAGSAHDAGFLPERLDFARRLLQTHVVSGKTPTLVASVARRGVVAFAEAFGQQYPDGPPASVDNIFALASLTKPVTATLIMCLVEDGVVGINNRVVDYIPELSAADNDTVLVHHLLTHTHGWDDDELLALTAARTEAGELPPFPADGDLLEFVFINPGWDAPRSRPVDTMMNYGNYGYQLLGNIVSRVTGMSIDAFARQRLFEPLGMTSTAFIVTDEMRPRLAHRPNGIPFGPDAVPLGMEGPMWEATQHGAAGLYSNAADMLTFGQMILNGGRYGDARILGKATVEAMTSNRLPGMSAKFGSILKREAGYGYGWVVRNFEAYAYFGSGLQPIGSLSHPGAGGVGMWIDKQHAVVGFFTEFATDLSDDLEPRSWVENRFEDVVVSALAEVD